MADTQNVARSLNPCIFQLQKLRFELNCALCLNMLNKPMLLPCNHIFCSSCVEFSIHCPACQGRFTNEELRPAFYVENIVAIYKNLDATFSSAILPLMSSDVGTTGSGSTSIGQSIKSLDVTAPKVQNNCIDPVSMGIELAKCSALEESDVNHAPEISPGSSPSSFVTKDADQGTNEIRVKSSVGDHLGVAEGMVDTKDTFHAREPKRQKKLNYGSSGTVLQSHDSQQIVSHSDPAVSKHEDVKSKENALIISSTAHWDASPGDGSVCALCHSTEITEQTGRMLHYADGKEVARDDAAFSKAIHIHSKCIEWAPQVYFVGDTIMNLESELARASKLRCSSCGLKGAALGCFAKSCRRSYHVPCAVEILDCRWDCDNFLMLCPIHKSTKFPSEKKAKSRKRPTREKDSLPSEITSEQLNFWATSKSRPQQWVLCGSALSSEEKCLMASFGMTSRATVYKFWNPKVTHVVAATDSNGACSRTLKVLMAILNGKWVLSIDWIKACVEANHPVDEEPYEINLDNHGFRDGPKTGRLRASTNAPKLFDGLSFYFNGDFIPSYKSDLVELVRVGGGTIIESMDHVVTERRVPTLVVYNHDLPQGCEGKEASLVSSKRVVEAQIVARSIDARVVPHTWILESIAACRILP